MLARVCSAAVNGIEAYPVEVEVNSGWAETLIVVFMPPLQGFGFADIVPGRRFALPWAILFRPDGAARNRDSTPAN
jgi:hypothetical protein